MFLQTNVNSINLASKKSKERLTNLESPSPAAAGEETQKFLFCHGDESGREMAEWCKP